MLFFPAYRTYVIQLREPAGQRSAYRRAALKGQRSAYRRAALKGQRSAYRRAALKGQRSAYRRAALKSKARVRSMGAFPGAIDLEPSMET